MKTKITLLLWVAAALILSDAGVRAQTFTVLHSFTQTNDGSEPVLGPAMSGNTLYGTAGEGGTNGNGAIFSIGADGGDFALLYTFSAYTNNTELGERGTN
jgi:uncharacterized repeat protein (TIGR03803 family)